MVARPYQTQAGSENYLHLAVSATELKAGDDLDINFNLRSNNQDVLNGVTYLTYIVSAINVGRVELPASI